MGLLDDGLADTRVSKANTASLNQGGLWLWLCFLQQRVFPEIAVADPKAAETILVACLKWLLANLLPLSSGRYVVLAAQTKIRSLQGSSRRAGDCIASWELRVKELETPRIYCSWSSRHRQRRRLDAVLRIGVPSDARVPLGKIRHAGGR